jgi:hypothetical protein
MPPLPPDLSRLGDDLQAAADRAIAARKASRAAFRRGLIVVLVAVTPAVLVMPEALAPLRPASIAARTPAGAFTGTEIAANEANVAAAVRASSRYPRGARLSPSLARRPRPGAMWNRASAGSRARPGPR